VQKEEDKNYWNEGGQDQWSEKKDDTKIGAEQYRK